MSISTASVNNSNKSSTGPLILHSYQHKYSTGIKDDILDNEDLVSFTEADMNPPQTMVPVPANSPFADAICPSTMQFMALFAENQHAGFIKLCKDEWTSAKRDFGGFIDILGQELYFDIDEDTTWKNTNISIHHPIRINGDRTSATYHTSFQAEFRQLTNTGYLRLGHFISMEPGNRTTVSVGIASASSKVMDALKYKVLKEVDLLIEVLSTEYVKQVFGTTWAGIDLLDTTGMLEKVPDHFYIDTSYPELLKLRHFLVVKRFDDIDVVSSGFMDKILDVYAALGPFFDLLCEWESDLRRPKNYFQS